VLRSLVRASLAQPFLTLLMGVILLIGGAWAWQQLPIDAFPDVSGTQVKIILKAPGMTPEEVEARIVAPVEQETLGIPGLRIVRSTAKYALADITLDFEDGTDIYLARQQVSERLAGAMQNLPADILGGLAPITTPLGEMFMFTIEGDSLSLSEKRSLLDWVIRPQLRTLPGVADVNTLGGEVRAYEVIPNIEALAARHLSSLDLERAIQANNRNDGAGRIGQGQEALLVRTIGAVERLDDLRQIPVVQGKGVLVRLGDVATVRIGAMTRYGAVTQNGKAEAVEGLVLGLRGSNARQVVEAVQARLDELAPTLPKGVTTRVFYNRGALVNRAVGTVTHALIEAVILVVLLLLAFLGEVRAALVVALMLPLAAAFTFLVMRFTGMSANLMSLGGLAIAIGMLVDGAVVVVENAVTVLAHGRHPGRSKGDLVLQAVSEVLVPVSSGVLIIILVFLPLLSLQGLEGKLFSPVALTIVFALAGSLILSLTVVPALAALMLKPGEHSDPWLSRNLQKLYRPALDLALRRPWPVLGATFAALVLAGFAFVNTGKAFMPTLEEGDLIVQLEKLPSIDLKESANLDMRLQERILREIPEIRQIVARTGSDELGLDPMGLNQTDTFLVLKPREEWQGRTKEDIEAGLRKVMADFPGLNYSFTQPIEMRVSEMLTGSRGDLAVKIFGPDLATLDQLAQRIATVMRAVPGASDVYSVRNDGVQYLAIRPDRIALGQAGLGVDALQATLRGALEGKPVGLVMEQGRRTPVLLRGDDEVRNSTALLARLPMALPDGGTRPLSDLATLEQGNGPVQINHENAGRFSVVQANVAGRDLVGFVEDARAAIQRQIPLPPGYRLVWGGQFENQQRAAKRLATVVPIALGAILLILNLTFGSIRQTLLVFANIPLAMIGGIVALWASGEFLSVPAAVGFIALLGVAVLNGVVMVSHFNQLIAEGIDMDDVVRDGSLRRLRPVMMTASIAALGLVPLIFATGPGSEIQRPLAIVVTGGLFSSTVLTLFILPILFRRFGGPRGAAVLES
jgi:cobalt-zinc-cadmium resistance protein CzcA